MSRLFPIEGRLRRYDWGGDDFIATLLGDPGIRGPVAEYWLGAHADSPSRVVLETGRESLPALIEKDPVCWLGREHASRLGQWPHLLKVLDVARPLSIQVHPDRDQARIGFEREEAAGVPRGAPERNFHDPNPKPELAVALDRFWLLFGVAPDDEIVSRLAPYPSLAELRKRVGAAGGAAVFRMILEAGDDKLADWLQPVLHAARGSAAQDRHRPEYWIARWLGDAPVAERVDRGVFGFLLMNILELQPGQGIFQGPGVPHAYLEGRIVELMTSSDNVLRCGLTGKHVDPDAVVAHAVLDSTPPRLVDPKGRAAQPGRMDYRCPVDDFLLSRWRLSAGQVAPVVQPGASILLVLAGAVRLHGDDHTLERSRGEAALCAGDTRLELEAVADCDVFMASVPERAESG